MARPKLDLAHMTVGTLRLGPRIDGGRHARFSYTCITCNETGERDARYLSRGCGACNLRTAAEGTSKLFSVATPHEFHSIGGAKLLQYLRKFPDAEDMHSDARYYYDGLRVRVYEDYEFVYVSQPTANGVPHRLSYPKHEQQVPAEFDWTLPGEVEPVERPKQIVPPVDRLDPLSTHHEIPVYTPPEPPEPPAIKPPYIVPEGWLRLEKAADAEWLGEDYPEGFPPQYLHHWMTEHKGIYRVAATNGELYAVSSPKPASSLDATVAMFDDIDDEVNAGEKVRQQAKAKAAAEAEAALESSMLSERVAAHRAQKACNKLRYAYEQSTRITGADAATVARFDKIAKEYLALEDTAKRLTRLAVAAEALVPELAEKAAKEKAAKAAKADEEFAKITASMPSVTE